MSISAREKDGGGGGGVSKAPGPSTILPVIAVFVKRIHR